MDTVVHIEPFSNRTGALSKSSPVHSGVPQGKVLDPLLFLAYINEINTYLSKDTKRRLFADDSLLYRTLWTPVDSENIKQDLIPYSNRRANKMVFHPDKCEVLQIKINIT